LIDATRRNTGGRSEKFLLPSVGGKADAKAKENGNGKEEKK
jgi:hypothetical protein